jgi:hypothetical protein
MRDFDGYLFRRCAGVVFCATCFANVTLGAPSTSSDKCATLKNSFAVPNTTITSAQNEPKTDYCGASSRRA